MLICASGARWRPSFHHHACAQCLPYLAILLACFLPLQVCCPPVPMAASVAAQATWRQAAGRCFLNVLRSATVDACCLARLRVQ